MRLNACLEPALYEEVIYTQSWEDLDVVRPARGARLERVAEARRINRRPPAVIGVEGRPSPGHVMTYFAHLNARFSTALPVDVLKLEEVLVAGRLLYQAEATEVAVILETFREIDRKYVHLSGEALAGDWSRAERMTESVGYVGSAGSSNYGHWLVDDLPRIIALVERTPRCELLLLPTASPEVNATKMSIISHVVADPPPLRFLADNELLICGELTYVTPCTFHPMIQSDQLLGVVRDRVRGATEDTVCPAKLAVVRTDGDQRRLLNGTEVAGQLASHGFSFCDPLAVGGVDQLLGFRRASTVVGVMGAEMANTLAAPPGCASLYMAPQGWLEPFYWCLAEALGHDYGCIFGLPADNLAAPQDRNFSIDPRFLDRLIESVAD